MHTNGPLTIFEDDYAVYVRDEKDKNIAEFFYFGSKERGEAVAHAHRFAANERMLAALEESVALYAGIPDINLKRAEREGSISLTVMNRILVARAAIKAARDGR